jgi:uncharacterized membrane protein
MSSMMTLLTGASLGAGAMYLMDPDRGYRRRTELRQALAEMGDSELVDRARRLEPLTTVRELGGVSGMAAMLDPARRLMGSQARTWAAALPALRALRRRRSSRLDGRGWALLGGLIGAVAAGLWLSRRAMGSREGIEVVRSTTVDTPLERVWELWNDFENFPRFMSHVREVRRTGPDRTHWVVAGPAGTPVEWDAVVTRRVPHEEIAWRTVEGSLVEHTGRVRFKRVGNGATRIDVRMTYRPLGGAVGHSLAALFGNDPERVIADDLGRLAEQLRSTRSAVGETGSWR